MTTTIRNFINEHSNNNLTISTSSDTYDINRKYMKQTNQYVTSIIDNYSEIYHYSDSTENLSNTILKEISESEINCIKTKSSVLYILDWQHIIKENVSYNDDTKNVTTHIKHTPNIKSEKYSVNEKWNILLDNKLQMTLSLVFNNQNKLLLCKKKRWFWQEYYNMPGGKQDVNETIHTTSARELFEETNIQTLSQTLIGTLHFITTNNSWFDISVYIVDDYTWDWTETEEMLPQWVPLQSIPFDKMWTEDSIWLKPFIDQIINQDLQSSKSFEYTFHTDETFTYISHTKDQ